MTMMWWMTDKSCFKAVKYNKISVCVVLVGGGAVYHPSFALTDNISILVLMNLKSQEKLMTETSTTNLCQGSVIS